MPTTVFEEAWVNRDAPFLYKNETIGVGILADAFPKFPDQVVIIPRDGLAKNEKASISDLDPKIALAMFCLMQFMSEKMASFSGLSGVRAVTHIEGFAVPNHPHMVMFPALRGESQELHKPSRYNSEDVRKLLVERTLKNLALTKQEKEVLDTQLGLLSFSH